MRLPIVLIIYNRPQLTQQVFDVIKRIKPTHLFIISDGPRTEKGEEETRKVHETRRIVEAVDWKCKVSKKFSETNLGCRRSVSEGLDWVFQHVDQAIILEDDCMPDPSFFPYCEELLAKYKDNKNIMMISGNNFISHVPLFSYGFCRHTLIWGWATWKRAWEQYGNAVRNGDKYINEESANLHRVMPKTRLDAIKKTLSGSIDTWDYLWQLALLMSNGLCIFPRANLVRNIGFGKDATHTKLRTFHSGLDTEPIRFPLSHPRSISVDADFDAATARTYAKTFVYFDIIKQLFR